MQEREDDLLAERNRMRKETFSKEKKHALTRSFHTSLTASEIT
jgi:hypothetical protein